MIFKFALLGALVRVLLANGSPLLCTSIYTVAVAIFAVFSGETSQGIVLGVWDQLHSLLRLFLASSALSGNDPGVLVSFSSSALLLGFSELANLFRSSDAA